MTQYRPTPEEEAQAKENQEDQNAKTFDAIVERVHDSVVEAAEDVEERDDMGVECNDEEDEEDS